MKSQCDDLQLKNRELLRQLAIARARAGAAAAHPTRQSQPAASARGARPLGNARASGAGSTGAPTRTHATAGAAAAGPLRQRTSFKHPQQLRYPDSDDDATHGSDYDSSGPPRRPRPQRPFRRFDPTAYQQERQRKLLRAGRSPSPSGTNGHTAAPAARRSSYTGGYTSDSSMGGYSSAASNDSNASSRRGRSRTRVSAQHQRAVVDRLASPKRIVDPDANGAPVPRFKAPRNSSSARGMAQPPPAPAMTTSRARSRSPAVTQRHRVSDSALPPPLHPPRLRQAAANALVSSPPPPPPMRSATVKRSTAAVRKRGQRESVVSKTPRPSSALLGDTTVDSFSDIDDRLNALQQFLKQAKQGGSAASGAPVTPTTPAGT